jgi:flap endonuclease-1
MGVDLGDLVPSETVSLETFDGKVLFLDGNNILYQFLATIRGPDGTPLEDEQGRVTSHLSGLLYRTANLVEAGILPVFVWDGKPPEEKKEEIERRRQRREEAAEAAEKAREEGDLETARTKAQQSSRLTSEMIDQAEGLLGRLGIPSVHAQAEGEATAAHATRDGNAYALVSQDYDALMFGTPRVVRYLTTRQKRKVPGKDKYVEVEPEMIRLERVLDELEISHEQLVAVGVLMGTDFNEGIDGVGPSTAIDAIREHETLEAAAKELGGEPELMSDVAEIFLDPEVSEVPTLDFGPVDEQAVVDYLVGEFSFSEDRVRKATDRYERLEDSRRQESLTDFF